MTRQWSFDRAHVDVNEYRIQLGIWEQLWSSCFSYTYYMSRTIEWEDAEWQEIFDPGDHQKEDEL